MRSLGLPFSCAMIMVSLVATVACTAPPVASSNSASAASEGSSKKNKTTSKGDDDDDDLLDDEGTTDDEGRTDDEGTGDGPTNTAQPSKFACSGAGIAAYADALVKAGRKSCTDHGTGVVKRDNYECTKTAIDSVAPPHPDTSFSIVKTLLAPNEEYPNLECTYFIQMVTSGVCGTPLSPTDMKWTDYPYAKEFINKAPAGWKWFANNGKNEAKLGDIFVYDAASSEEPGHIMIVAEVMSGGKFRIAEANELNADGSAAFEETGVMSNTRVTTLSGDDQKAAGWFRLDPK